MRVTSFFTIHCTDVWVSHACLALAEHVAGDGLEVDLVVPSAERRAVRPFVHSVVPWWLNRLAFRVDRMRPFLQRRAAQRFRRLLRDADAAWPWTGVPVPLFTEMRALGKPIVLERINCHRATSRRILDEARRRAGLVGPSQISEADTHEEQRKIDLADFVFAPSPAVARSLLDAGVAPAKILRTSYGWSPRKLAPPPRTPVDRDPVFLFVGTLNLRKGIHLLLAAWARAQVRGTLVVCGDVKPEVEALLAPHRGRSDVRFVGYSDDLPSLYRAADVFVFSSLEEGSPLVSYEALAFGLAPILSPMGAGDVARDGIEALVVDPYDQDGWVEAIRRVANDADLRARLGRAAALRAQEYTWDKVGSRRRALFRAALAGRVPAAAGT